MNSLVSEAFAMREQEERVDRLEAWDRAMGRLPCPWCGSIDGMEAWSRENVAAAMACPERYPLPAGFYRAAYTDHELFTPCWGCNRTGVVGDAQVLVTEEELLAWLARPCGCQDCQSESAVELDLLGYVCRTGAARAPRAAPPVCVGGE